MRLLERVRDVALRRRLAASTIECYQAWIGQFLRFSRRQEVWRTPGELTAEDVERFLTHLARDRRLSASSQNQATCAIVFLYKQVLGSWRRIIWGDSMPSAPTGRRACPRSSAPARRCR